MDNIVITDTSCFILLDKLDVLNILHSLYENVVTTAEIANEFGKPLPDWITIRTVINKNLQKSFLEKVDSGEASAIALAMELSSPLLILDDLKGRKLAADLKLNYTGTLGVLILGRRKEVIPKLKPYFDLIKHSDFRISNELLDKILADFDEL